MLTDPRARDLGLPRSTTCHLLNELMTAGFVVHLADDRVMHGNQVLYVIEERAPGRAPHRRPRLVQRLVPAR